MTCYPCLDHPAGDFPGCFAQGGDGACEQLNSDIGGLMRARTMNCYWCFQAPIGYRYERVSEHGNLLVREEPNATIIQEALEGFATGRFETQVEVRRFLESQPAFPKDLPGGKIRNQRVFDIVRRPVYVGYIEAENWNIALRKGHHEGLISYETFEKIQDRLLEGAKAPARKDINEDFPLRGFVTCDDCERPLTACWSTSKTGKKHPYYLCHNKACESHRKSIPRDKLETEFEAILQSMQPTENLFVIVKTMFKHAWNQRLIQSKDTMSKLRQDVKKAERQIDQLLDRIVDAENASVIRAYETKIAKLEKQN